MDELICAYDQVSWMSFSQMALGKDKRTAKINNKLTTYTQQQKTGIYPLKNQLITELPSKHSHQMSVKQTRVNRGLGKYQQANCKNQNVG